MVTTTRDSENRLARARDTQGSALSLDLSATRAPLASARTLPAAAYTSADVFRIEQQEIFARMWVCIGREADLPAAGDFLTVAVAGDSVIVVRGTDDVLRAFYNVCRHRGARLIDDACGHGLSRVVCPYHAWTYRLDGTLAQAPRMVPEFAKDQHSLVPVRLDTYQGFLYVNLDESAEPLAHYLAELPDLTRFRMADLRCGKRAEYTVDANWKLIGENYSECYHCPGVHPQLFRVSDNLSRAERMQETGNCFNGGPMVLRDGMQTMSMTGRRSVPTIPGLLPEDDRLVYYYFVYPNMFLSPHPDYVLTHTLWPLAPGRTKVVCEWLFTQPALAQPDFDPIDMVEFWDVTNRQDWGLCERTQLGAASRGFRPGPYHPSEDCVHTFDRWYAERMSKVLA
jgi:phenylpropionate dioxygenase-like ring-hydroxylating dioxygenase large terminal subunit